MIQCENCIWFKEKKCRKIDFFRKQIEEINFLHDMEYKIIKCKEFEYYDWE